MDPEFLKELANCSICKTIEFIPYIKKGMMMTKVFHAAMKQQHEFNKNVITISVVGISGLKVEVNCHGKMTSLVNMIHKLRDSNGSAIFSGMEPTKLMAAQGWFLFLMQKPIIDKAEKLLDQLFKQLAYEGHLDAFMMEGHKIQCLNQVQSKAMTKYAEGLVAKFKPMESMSGPTPKLPPAPVHNGWNCTSKFKFDQENFPNLGSPSHVHTVKKQCCTLKEDDANSQHLEPSQQMGVTKITNECTEFVQQLLASFTKKLNLMKKDHKDQQKKIDAHLKAMEAALNKSQEQLLQEFQSMTNNYASTQQSYANLHSNFQMQCLIKDRHALKLRTECPRWWKLSIWTKLLPKESSLHHWHQTKLKRWKPQHMDNNHKYMSPLLNKILKWMKSHLDAYLATAKVILEQNVDPG